ncbi:unnamed protein product, partial [Lampetra planeri]
WAVERWRVWGSGGGLGSFSWEGARGGAGRVGGGAAVGQGGGVSGGGWRGARAPCPAATTRRHTPGRPMATTPGDTRSLPGHGGREWPLTSESVLAPPPTPCPPSPHPPLHQAAPSGVVKYGQTAPPSRSTRRGEDVSVQQGIAMRAAVGLARL